MSDLQPRYWFPAKRYGWGWGPPKVWQGWLVLGLWLIAVSIASIMTLILAQRWELFAGSLVVLTIALVIICWWKGEPPRWRWGGA